jgi:hypothetical protein
MTESDGPVQIDELAAIGVDRWHPFRADCEAVLDHCRHRRYGEAAEHMMRLAAQYKDAWGRNREAWMDFALQLEAVALPGNPLGVRLLRDAVRDVARGRRLSWREKMLERIPLLRN